MSADILLQSILDELKTLNNNFLERRSYSEIDQWIDSYDLAIKLHVSSRTLHRLRKNGTLKYTKIKGKIFYRITDVNNMLSGK